MKCSGDEYITQILTDQNKLVAADRLFLLTSDTIYSEKIKDTTVKFKTYHTNNLPNRITINRSNRLSRININSEKKWSNITLLPGDQSYEIRPQHGDKIIESKNYFAFTKNSYLTPKI